MEKQHLGIASIPCQTWGELFTPEEALQLGTIFKELNKPFFASDLLSGKIFENIPQNASPTENEQGHLLAKINEISFVLDDLTLYLDTHSDDMNALQLYQEFSQKRVELKKQFAQQFYPLTRDCLAECGTTHDGFYWQSGPAPWEGACV